MPPLLHAREPERSGIAAEVTLIASTVTRVTMSCIRRRHALQCWTLIQAIGHVQVLGRMPAMRFASRETEALVPND
jgi:hypothetical protein